MKFFKTPKGLLTIVLAILIVLAAPHEGIATVAPGLLSAVFCAGLVDMVILRIRSRRVVKSWTFRVAPSSPR